MIRRLGKHFQSAEFKSVDGRNAFNRSARNQPTQVISCGNRILRIEQWAAQWESLPGVGAFPAPDSQMKKGTEGEVSHVGGCRGRAGDGNTTAASPIGLAGSCFPFQTMVDCLHHFWVPVGIVRGDKELACSQHERFFFARLLRPIKYTIVQKNFYEAQISLIARRRIKSARLFRF